MLLSTPLVVEERVARGEKAVGTVKEVTVATRAERRIRNFILRGEGVGMEGKLGES